MLIRIVLCLWLIAPIASQLEGGVWDRIKGFLWKSHEETIPMVRVLVVHDQPSAMLEVTGKYHISDPNAKDRLGSRTLGKRKEIESKPSGLKWGEEFPGVYQLQIIPDEESVVAAINGVSYPGTLFIYDIGGTISATNRLTLEEYLQLTLPQQFSEPLPDELLAAIAITARTDLLYTIRHPHNPYWEIDGRRVNYRGLEGSEGGDEMREAIEATRYMVMSRTGSYEGRVTPFPASWTAQGDEKGKVVVSKISLEEAEEMARRGENAAQILAKAFPGSQIELLSVR